MTAIKSRDEFNRGFASKAKEGRIGWALLWMMGVPVSILLVVFLLWSGT